ncbi:hypothetical protein PIB30_067050 [Stylosanthes scabra]|uniref:Uncharacterized protein n=1 Tax=Stylosanthes scabra TaxID=79078 RepID=A0ABU6TND9_9FABA|nr:hypothetical protein [Stylosanthes scabra]
MEDPLSSQSAAYPALLMDRKKTHNEGGMRAYVVERSIVVPNAAEPHQNQPHHHQLQFPLYEPQQLENEKGVLASGRSSPSNSGELPSPSLFIEVSNCLGASRRSLLRPP